MPMPLIESDDGPYGWLQPEEYTCNTHLLTASLIHKTRICFDIQQLGINNPFPVFVLMKAKRYGKVS